MFSTIIKIDPSASPQAAEKLIEIWEEVVSSIIEEMVNYANNETEDLHINLREEMIFELSKLILYLSEAVVHNRLNNRTISEIDPKTERIECFNKKGKSKISTTAKNFAEGFWIKKYKERWKPKTEKLLNKEQNNKHKYQRKHIVPKKTDENHFIPKFFIKKYWSNDDYVYKNVKTPEGINEKIRTPVGGWAYRRNLYSNYLEAYFSLLEGDAVKPIQMILNVEPLNIPQREALIGFIVIQRLRNPFFIEAISRAVTPTVAKHVGEERTRDSEYMRAVYETLYKQNHLYDKLANPIFNSRWVVVRSGTPDFILPDVCNIFGMYEDKQYVVMPLTPKNCLVVLPVEAEEARVIPHYIKAPASLASDISYILIDAAKEEFLSDSEASLINLDEESTKVTQRIIISLSQIINGC